ncbi:MAG: SGNH/GDSL hydrolase family protein, partial [Lachnospiraceae bacterium]|nr:SGNH/GDSL hydrolase family protein [Lachnospiraceae bacterium]
DEMEIDGLTDYYDNRAHTNALGSEKVTAYLGQYLREHYDLPDRRGDAAYASWDEAYARWQSEHAEAVREILSKVEN